jgi:lipid II:glycine glycyltransferase (peptidoglycan interpeptide bridge formation enzyme)
MIYYRKKNGAKMAEIWYNFDEKLVEKVDVLRYKYVTQKQDTAASFEELWTLLTDLEKSDDELFLQINKTCKYQINRAKNKDGVVGETLLETGEKNEQKITQYIDFFNTFADSKGRSHIDFSDLEQFYDSGTFCVRTVVSGDGTALTMHGYVVSDNTARLHQSSSLFRNSEDAEYRNMVGRANRLLHWEDMLYFKQLGIKYYDFGGWFGGEATTENYKEQLLINQFKESFGGEKKQEYSFIMPASFLGKAAVKIHSVLKRGK